MRVLEHVLKALVQCLAGLQMEVADDFVLHVGGEHLEGRCGDVKVLRTEFLDERTQPVLRSHTWIGDYGPRHLGYPLGRNTELFPSPFTTCVTLPRLIVD